MCACALFRSIPWLTILAVKVKSISLTHQNTWRKLCVSNLFQGFITSFSLDAFVSFLSFCVILFTLSDKLFTQHISSSEIRNSKCIECSYQFVFSFYHFPSTKKKIKDDFKCEVTSNTLKWLVRFLFWIIIYFYTICFIN